MQYGTFKHGQDRSNKRQSRWMFDELSQAKQEILLARLASLGYLRKTNHLLHKERDENFCLTNNMIRHALMHGSLIEYSNVRYDTLCERVLIRDNSRAYQVVVNGIMTLCNICFVVDLTKSAIITAYWNAVDDNHSTLNRKKYRKAVA